MLNIVYIVKDSKKFDFFKKRNGEQNMANNVLIVYFLTNKILYFLKFLAKLISGL